MGKRTSGNYNVVFTGFKDEEQARKFVSWFSEAGEQDASNALEAEGIESITVDNDAMAKGMPKKAEFLDGIKKTITVSGGRKMSVEQPALLVPLSIYEVADEEEE